MSLRVSPIMSAMHGIAWPSHVASEPCRDGETRWATPAPSPLPAPACSPAEWVRVRVRVNPNPGSGFLFLPHDMAQGRLSVSAQGGEPRPLEKACLKPDGESGTSGPDEGCLCRENMPELALLGERWRRGRTRSAPIRRGCGPHPYPTPSTKCMQISANICNVSSPPGPALARGECGESLANARPPGGILQGAS